MYNSEGMYFLLLYCANIRILFIIMQFRAYNDESMHYFKIFKNYYRSHKDRIGYVRSCLQRGVDSILISNY